MNRRVGWLRVEAAATRLLTEAGIPYPPIDVEGIARLRRLKIVRAHAPNTSACGSLDREKMEIGINSSQSETRQRFTIAHELGHFVLGHQSKHATSRLLYRDDVSASGSDVQEIEANWFAAQLLMPKHFLRQSIAAYPRLDEDGIAALAGQYKVSEQSMSIRLSKLGLLSLWSPD